MVGTVSNNKSKGKAVREHCMKAYWGMEVQLLNLRNVRSWVTNCTPSLQGRREEEHIAAVGNRDPDRTTGS